MTNTVLVCIFLAINSWGGYFSSLIRKMPHPPEYKSQVNPYVTPTHPDLTNPNAVNQESSVIVEPKSPQLVAWEEEEQVRKLNLKPR